MRAALRRILLAVLAVLAVAGVWTAVALVQSREDLTRAKELLEAAAEAEQVDDARPELRRAQEHLEATADRLGRPGPWLVSVLPVVGRSVDATRTTAAAGAAVVAGGQEVLDAIPERLLSGGQLDLDGAAEVEQALRAAVARTRRPVAQLDAVELRGTPGVLAEGVEEARDRLGDAPAAFERAADGLAGLRAVLGGERERRLLIVLQNNAELRATGGLVSVFAQATARDGQLVLGSFQEVGEVADDAGETRQVPAPADFRRLFGPFKADTTLWKNVNMSADVPTSSAVLAEVAAATLEAEPDVILWIDVPAIAALLSATGPVTLPDGSQLSSGNAVRRLLSEVYANAQQDVDGQERRQDELRAAGDAVIGQLLDPGSEISAVELAQELVPAAAGRHLALWSAEPDEQELLVSARLAGQSRAEGGDLSSFAVHNLGDGAGFGNKLDFYGRRQVTVRVEVDLDSAVVEQELAVRNTAPGSGLPVYVSGKVDPGVANALVTVALPATAELEEFRRGEEPLQVSPQPMLDHSLIVDLARIPPGETATWRLRYRLPLDGGRYTSRLVPQPLAVDAGLLLQVRAAEGSELRDGGIERSGPYDEVVRIDVVSRRPPLWVRARDAVRRFWNEPVPLP